MKLILLQDVAAQPWRNGGGVTRELLAWPAGADWQLRISVADIDQDGPFSPFPGVVRWFAVLSGTGVELGLATGPVQLRVGDAACTFDGAGAPDCRLLGGPTRDLNLMLRGTIGDLQHVVDACTWSPEAAQCGLFTPVAGQLLTDDGEPQAVPAMSLSWWETAPGRLVFRRESHVDDGAALSPAWWLSATPLVRETPA